MIYGTASPYARQAEYATIDAIDVAALRAYHRRCFAPERMHVAVWGDFSTSRMRASLEQWFGDWPRGNSAPVVASVTEAPAGARLHLIPRPDQNQSVVLCGHLGSDAHDRDFAAITMMNEILGGPFTGRLFKRVRSDQGLAYQVFGGYNLGLDRPGLCPIGCVTRGGATGQALAAMRHEVDLLRTQPVTEQELALAKTSYRHVYLYNFATRAQQIENAAIVAHYGYPVDFMQTSLAAVASVTVADVLRVARERLRPDEMRVLVLGDPAAFAGPLGASGTVREIDVAIPPR